MAYGSTDLQAACTSVTSTAVSVGNTATALPATAATARKSMIVFNNAPSGGQTVFLGPAGVTTASGLPVPPQSSASIDLGTQVGLFGITAASTADVRVLEIA